MVPIYHTCAIGQQHERQLNKKFRPTAAQRRQKQQHTTPLSGTDLQPSPAPSRQEGAIQQELPIMGPLIDVLLVIVVVVVGMVIVLATMGMAEQQRWLPWREVMVDMVMVMVMHCLHHL